MYLYVYKYILGLELGTEPELALTGQVDPGLGSGDNNQDKVDDTSDNEKDKKCYSKEFKKELKNIVEDEFKELRKKFHTVPIVEDVGVRFSFNRSSQLCYELDYNDTFTWNRVEIDDHQGSSSSSSSSSCNNPIEDEEEVIFDIEKILERNPEPLKYCGPSVVEMEESKKEIGKSGGAAGSKKGKGKGNGGRDEEIDGRGGGDKNKGKRKFSKISKKSNIEFECEDDDDEDDDDVDDDDDNASDTSGLFRKEKRNESKKYNSCHNNVLDNKIIQDSITDSQIGDGDGIISRRHPILAVNDVQTPKIIHEKESYLFNNDGGYGVINTREYPCLRELQIERIKNPSNSKELVSYKITFPSNEDLKISVIEFKGCHGCCKESVEIYNFKGCEAEDMLEWRKIMHSKDYSYVGLLSFYAMICAFNLTNSPNKGENGICNNFFEKTFDSNERKNAFYCRFSPQFQASKDSSSDNSDDDDENDYYVHIQELATELKNTKVSIGNFVRNKIMTWNRENSSLNGI
jgi:hypothetical protein